MLFNIIALAMIFIGIILLIYSIQAFKNITNLLFLTYALMTLGMAIFSFGYGWELFAHDLNSTIMAVKFQYLGISFLSVYWIIFAYKFRYGKYPDVHLLISIFIVPLLTFFLVMTYENNDLYYKDITVIFEQNNYVTHLTRGIFYYFFIFYSYCVTILLNISFFYTYKRRLDNQKIQSKLMLIGSFFPFLFNILYFLKLTPLNLDPTCFGFLILSYFWHKALFKYQYLDLNEITKFAAFNGISGGAFIVDTNNRIVDFNHFASDTCSFFTPKNIGKDIKDFDFGLKILENEGKDFFELCFQKEGKPHLFEVKKSPVLFRKKIIAFMYMFSDITDTKDLITDLSYLATHDFLTGIPNKMDFSKLALAEYSLSKRNLQEFSIAVIDIDYFKDINDNFGHLCGDEILKQLSASINSQIRTTDYFGRFGGDEFCIFLSSTSLKNAVRFGEKIRKNIENTVFKIADSSIKITISIGISAYSPLVNSSQSLEDVMATADKALYISKNNGRNSVSSMR